MPPSAHLLRTLAAVPPAARVLDLGCGRGRHAEPMARLGFDLWACDPDEDAVAEARRRLAEVMGEEEAERRATLAHARALGYADDTFDWVVAYGAYDGAEDAAELAEMLAETKRVLRPGGWVFAAFGREAAGPALTPETLAKVFAEAGFALAEAPAEEEGESVIRGIFRKVTAETPV